MSQEITEQFKIYYVKRAKDYVEMVSEQFINHEWLDPLLVNADVRQPFLDNLEQELLDATNLEFDKQYTQEELENSGFHNYAVMFYKRCRLGASLDSKPIPNGVIQKQKPKDFVAKLEVGKCYDLPSGMSGSGVIGAGYKQGMKISVSMIEGKWIVYRRA